MSRDDEQCLRLGREVVRMIGELRGTAGSDAGYTRRTFTFPGGEVTMFLVVTDELAGLLEAAATKAYDVATVTPPSQVN